MLGMHAAFPDTPAGSGASLARPLSTTGASIDTQTAMPSPSAAALQAAALSFHGLKALPRPSQSPPPRAHSPRQRRCSQSAAPAPVNSSIEDVSVLTGMFGGNAGGAAGVSGRKDSHQAVNKHRTGPGGGSPQSTAGICGPQPQYKNPPLTAVTLAGQLSTSARSSPAPRTADGLHDAYGIPAITLPPVHPGLRKKSSEVVSGLSTRARGSVEFEKPPPRPATPPKQGQPPPRKAPVKPLSGMSAGAESDSDQDIYADAPEQPPALRAAPAPPAPRRNRGPKRRAPSQASASQPPPPRASAAVRDTMPAIPARRASPPLLPPSRQSTLRSTPAQTTTTVSSRAQTPLPTHAPRRFPAPAPKKTPAPPPPLRRRRSAPTPGLKPTMRPARPSPGLPKEKPSLKLKHAHKHSLSTHPLHVSTSTIAEKDRKRYEGVWAANRGYLMHTLALPPDEMAETLAEGVHPLVVRELWGRSRLGREMLAEVWRLVDRGGKGWLGREEFVVGMWLVDRGLEGRKAPMGGVGGGVWGSARRLGG